MMAHFIKEHRSSGILAHITSLPSEYGIGDLGPGTSNFLSYLEKCGQTIWQILPLCPTSGIYSHSPYMSVSAFAGNPLLLSPDILYEDGLLQKSEIRHQQDFSPYFVDFDKVSTFKSSLLRSAYPRFVEHNFASFEQFLSQSHWLDNYCMFMVMKSIFPKKAWYQWDHDLVNRDESALSALKKRHSAKYRYFQFEQFLFYHQWQKLRGHAKNHNISIFGDIPIYVSLDSADVWSNQDIFELDPATHLPTRVAGVPPDYFSETGQLWGNPLYRWNDTTATVKKRILSWWTERFEHTFQQVDIARIDHFRGFESYWSIPASAKTAASGEWLKGPGYAFFDSIFQSLGQLNIVAEDLGIITRQVELLREKLDFPGMKILQFAFDGDPANAYLPYNFHNPNTIIYTGTHDNDTSVGWFLDQAMPDKTRKIIKQFANRDTNDQRGVHIDLLYLAMASIAKTCIFPLQDILGFGSDCRMNTPGTTDNNWRWRCDKKFLSEETARWLYEITQQFGRLSSSVSGTSPSDENLDQQ